jgi:serine protease Do
MRVRSYLMALVAPYVVIGVVAFTVPHLAGAAGNTPPVAAAPALPTPPPAKTPSHDGFAGVVTRVRPAIVSIMAEKRAEAQMNVFQLGGMGGMGGMDEAPIMKGIGSGIVTSADGYILTNNHVVDGATSLRVRLADGREYVGKVVGADAHTDVAVVKIDAKGLTPVQFADSDKLVVGQYALAIGSPFGMESSVSLGIVSATQRGELGITDYEDFIQTDAAINPGNSGGALIDADGNVIGMATAIVANGGRGNLGVGLAVPANLARAVAAQLTAHGKVERGFLGAGIQDVTADLAAAMGRASGGGALVGDVKAGEAAARAGVQPGDVVVELDGLPIHSARELRLHVASTAPHTKVKLVVERSGKRVPLDVTLGTLPEESAQLGRGHGRGGRDDASQPPAGYGMQVGPLTSEIARELELPAKTRGVVVMNVAPGSRADEAGLERGDLIEELDRKPANDPDQLVQALRSKDSGQHLLRVRRGEHLKYVALPALK